MTTKQEYIDILGQMEELYYNSDNCTLSMNLFKEDIHLLTGLVNEHFEDKIETNYEHYKDGILQNVKYALAVVNDEPKSCIDTNCGECDFKDSGECVKRVREWLNQQYKKPTYKLTQFEFDLIQTYRDGNTNCKLSARRILRELKDKGYFKCVDYDTKVKDILENCEVIR